MVFETTCEITRFYLEANLTNLILDCTNVGAAPLSHSTSKVKLDLVSTKTGEQSVPQIVAIAGIHQIATCNMASNWE